MEKCKKWICYLLIFCLIFGSPATLNVVGAAGLSAEPDVLQESATTENPQADPEEGTDGELEDESDEEEMPPASDDQVDDETQAHEEDEATTRASDLVAYEDGINDNWQQDSATVKGGEVCAIEDRWLHLQAGPSNGNNPSNTVPPAVFVSDTTHDFDVEGFFETDMRTVQDGKLNRVGIYLGYTDQFNGMFFGYNSGGWYWQKYGADNTYSSSAGTVPGANSTVKVRIDWTADKKATLSVDGNKIFSDIDFGIYTTLGNQIGIKCGTFSAEISDIYLKNMHYTGQAEAQTYVVSGKILDDSNAPVKGAKVTIEGKTVSTDDDGKYNLEGIVSGEYTLTAIKKGYKTYTEEIEVSADNLIVPDITLEKQTAFPQKMISSDEMDVYVAEHFPSVVKYILKNEDNKEFAGQETEIDTITINGTNISLANTDITGTFDDTNKATYVMHVENAVTQIDADITAELVVEKNTLAFNITEITNNLDNDQHPIETIYIPNHSLVSINSDQDNPNLKGANMSSSTAKSGDTYLELEENTANKTMDYMYAFVSNKELSAGLWSNAEYEGSYTYAGITGGSRNTRVMATIANGSGNKTLGLGSTPWYYQRKINSKGTDYVVPETDLPKTKIIITSDQNGDGQVDWQDGAIAFREIMHNPYKYEEVPELVAWRIAMNFGGQAANPFLTTLDNVKRVALNIDGLAQSVLLKGYGNEGHDSGHPDYADIGTRIGGAKDMNTLMEQGKAYGARFGIHINGSEMYPEAKAFNEDLVRYKPNGRLSYGWNWLDKAVGIDAYYDLGSGARRTRFNDLKAQIGDNMDFIYVDVWGNNTTGVEDSWETRQFSKEIIDNGWRVTTEWGAANEYDSTFQHWAADLSYGGFDAKGINSAVMRFLRNHQKDSWVGDYPSYTGAANAPLLGGYNMKDFEGWQGRNNYDEYMENLFTHNISTKFLQHYKVMKWVDGTAVGYSTPATPSKPSIDYVWNPEMEITLQDDQKDNTVVVTRGSNDKNSADFRARTMTLNDKVILTGTMSAGDSMSAATRGTESYLIPWIWDAEDGTVLGTADQRLYHWNTQGGTSTWELPDGWENLGSVVVYKLTDQGKTEEKTVNVSGGSVTLTADARTAYVVYQGARGNIDVTWSEDMHIVDAGFNGGEVGLEENWNKAGTGEATIAKSQHSNPMLKLSGDVTMSQTLTDLEPGTQYAVYVGVDNRSDAKAWLSLETDGEEIAANYTTKSIAKNYVKSYTHSNSSATVDGNSYFQNLYVFFTAPSTEVVLNLKKEAGSGATYFDDIRVVENESQNITKDENGEIVKFEQDFETVVQGIYPFVIGPVEGVNDNRTHLSELHAPYTQSGWNIKEVDDVLDGNWSIKTNGLVGRNSLVYQTIPQNFRFEAGERYKVRFDYQAGYDNTYAFAVGVGDVAQAAPLRTNLEGSAGVTKTVEFDVMGDDSGQGWIGFYSTTVKPPVDRFIDDHDVDFSGINDLIVDNLVIEKVAEKINKDDLMALIDECLALEESDYGYTGWKAFMTAVTSAQVTLDRENATEKEVIAAYQALLKAKATLLGSGSKEEDDAHDIEVDKIAAGSAQGLSSGGVEGPIELAVDGNPGTYWHTKWSETAVPDKSWFEFSYTTPVTVDGMRYLPRPGAANANGKILDYKIMVSTDNGETWTEAKRGTFVSATTWQLAEFDQPIEGVNAIRLYALTTTGQSTGEMNKFASAAELRVTAPKGNQVDEVDKTVLKDLLADVSALTEACYTPESWELLAKEKTAAAVVVAKEDATEYEVLFAYQELKLAKNQLVAQLAKEDLEELLSDVSSLKESDYTADSWNTFAEAKKAVEDIIQKSKATDEEIYQAYVNLQKAKDNLKKPDVNAVDKKQLDKAIKDYAGLKSSDYTPDSWKAFDAAYKKAQAVSKDQKATVAEVKNALDALNAAKSALKLKPVTPASPTVKSSGYNKLKISWKKANGADGYEVYRATSKTGSYKLHATIKSGNTVSYTDSKLTTGKTYYYKIRSYVTANGTKLTSPDTAIKSGKPVPAAVTLSTVKNTAGKKNKLSWKKVSGANGYVVYRATSKNGKYKKIATLKKGSAKTYTDSKLTNKKTHYYKVRAYRNVSGKKVYGPYSAIKSGKLAPAAVSLTAVKNTSSKKIKLTWKKVSGANGYAVYRATSKNGKFEKVATIKKGTTTSYTNSKLKKGKTYYYKVRAFKNVDGKQIFGSYSSVQSAKVNK